MHQVSRLLNISRETLTHRLADHMVPVIAESEAQTKAVLATASYATIRELGSYWFELVTLPNEVTT